MSNSLWQESYISEKLFGFLLGGLLQKVPPHLGQLIVNRDRIVSDVLSKGGTHYIFSSLGCVRHKIHLQI